MWSLPLEVPSGAQNRCGRQTDERVTWTRQCTTVSTVGRVAVGAQRREQSLNSGGHEALPRGGIGVGPQEGILGQGSNVSEGQQADRAWRENRVGPQTRVGRRIAEVWPGSSLSVAPGICVEFSFCFPTLEAS